jgi:hypothetical protein
MNKPHAFAAFSFKRFLIDGNKLFFLPVFVYHHDTRARENLSPRARDRTRKGTSI